MSGGTPKAKTRSLSDADVVVGATEDEDYEKGKEEDEDAEASGHFQSTVQVDSTSGSISNAKEDSASTVSSGTTSNAEPVTPAEKVKDKDKDKDKDKGDVPRRSSAGGAAGARNTLLKGNPNLGDHGAVKIPVGINISPISGCFYLPLLSSLSLCSLCVLLAHTTSEFIALDKLYCMICTFIWQFLSL